MRPAFIDADRLARLLPIGDAIDALEAMFAAPLPETPRRVRSETSSGELLLMPAFGSRYVGVKLVTVAPANPSRDLPVVQGTYVLLDAGTLTPVSVLDGTALTALRTAAVSGLATRHLARPDARALVIFGAGVQGNAHLAAIMAVREAHIVCTCTTSPRPLFDGSQLRPGAHVNAVGAYRPDQRELDDDTVRRGKLVVETREAALAEAGDLLIPIERGVIGRDDIVADLAEIVQGERVRRSSEDVTVFKSVGVAFEDLAVAAAAYERYAP